jgi:CRISPR-associated protein Csx17
MPTITLNGSAPVPLAHYLKALGILRLVSESEHGDSSATAHWLNDQLVLTSRFDREALLKFLLHDYSPTPVLNPWNGDGGFFEDSRAGAVATLDNFSRSMADRLRPYRDTIVKIRSEFEHHGIKEKPTDEDKARVLHLLRGSLSDVAVQWLDAVVVLIGSGAKYPPLLGSGGNDGSIDFSKNFMQRLLLVIEAESGNPRHNSDNLLCASLFQEPTHGSTTSDKIGQFFPGAAGGANSTAGFSGEPFTNPWDFVLMIEGTLLFAAASVKRLESSGDGALVFPFCVQKAGVGYASAVRADEETNGCEIWLPLWDKPASYAELFAVFSEGRSQLQGHPARNGVDFAQAAVTLGVDRGITAFQRYALLERNGQSNFATPLGKFIVRRNARADLLADIQRWIARLRVKTDSEAKPKAPNAVQSAFNLVERRIVELCHQDSPDRLQSLLASLGAAERAVARSFKWATTKDKFQRENANPLHGLRPEWLTQIADCAEARLAASLAGISASFGRGKETLWFRQHLEPLKRAERGEFFRPAWTDKSSENDVAWHDGDLTDAFNAILARRVMRVGQSGAKGWPDEAKRFARLDDITDFIEGRTNDDLLADLIWGLSLLDWQQVKPLSSEHRETTDAIPSSFYAMLRLCFRPAIGNEDAIPLVPAILHRAMNGDGQSASQLAARRLRGSGKAPLVKDLPVSGDIARRTAAAMLFPIAPQDFYQLERSILQPSKK